MARSDRGVLRVFPWEMPDDIEFYYTEEPKPAGAGINPDLHPMRWRMWELVALGLFLYGSPARNLMSRTLRSHEETEPWVLHALGPQLEELEPAWQLTARTQVVLKGDLEVAAASCGLPLEIVAASTNNGTGRF